MPNYGKKGRVYYVDSAPVKNVITMKNYTWQKCPECGFTFLDKSNNPHQDRMCPFCDGEVCHQDADLSVDIRLRPILYGDV